MKEKYLCALFNITSGLNNERLGSDEAEIVFIGTLIIDLNSHKVVATNYQFVRPRIADVKVDFLTDECKLDTELNEAYFYNAKYLEIVLDEFDSFLKTQNLHPEVNDCELIMVTDGPLHLRQALIPECSKKNIKLPQYFYSFIDLRKEFSRFFQRENISGINSMLEYLLIPQNIESNFGIKNCNNMEQIILQMLRDDCKFDEVEKIMHVMDSGIWFISVDDDIEDNTIIKARGLPWQCSEQDVAKFFRGLNISKGGIALCLSSQGRRNGEALVRFINEEQRDLALNRHKHHIGQRYIEVYRASGKDFLNIAGGTNTEAQIFLSRNGQVIVRMRGLPFDANAKEVVDFFENGNNSTQIVDGEAGVLFVKYPDGRATGDAFVMFSSDDEASRALLKHKETMGTRYIELFRSTTAEVQQVFKRSQDPKHYQNTIKDIPSFTAPPLPLLPPEMISGGNRRDCIRLRNLPLDCTVETILEFLGNHRHHIVPQGVHMIYNAQGQPSGEAFIQMNGELSAYNASNHKNNKYVFFSGKKYYIEVIQCSGEEMNLVLMGVVPSNLLSLTQNASLTPRTTQTLLPSSLTTFPLTTPTSAGLPTTLYPPATLTTLPLTAPTTTNTSITSNSQYYPQIVYWYQPPTPPVSPSSTIYIHPSSLIHATAQTPCMIILRGAPQSITVNDVLQFLNGFPDVTPETIQIQRGLDGRPTGDVWITFLNRSEAERAIIEKNHQMIGNRLIEIYLAV